MTKNDEEIIELLKIWFFLKINNVVWPAAIRALEDKIYDLAQHGADEWKHAPLGPAQ